MIRQSNPQAYVKYFYNMTIPQLSITNIPLTPYYSYYKPKLINNNSNLIYGRYR